MKVFALVPGQGLRSPVGAVFEDPERGGAERILSVRDVWVELVLNRVGPVSRKINVDQQDQCRPGLNLKRKRLRQMLEQH